MSDPDTAARLQALEAQVAQLSAGLTALRSVFIEEACLSSGMPANIIEGKLAKASAAKSAAPGAPGSIRR